MTSAATRMTPGQRLFARRRSAYLRHRRTWHSARTQRRQRPSSDGAGCPQLLESARTALQVLERRRARQYPGGAGNTEDRHGMSDHATYPAADASTPRRPTTSGASTPGPRRSSLRSSSSAGRSSYRSGPRASVAPRARAGSAPLVDRKNGGTPRDVVLGSMSREYTPWPTTRSSPGQDCGAAGFPCGRQRPSHQHHPHQRWADSRLLLDAYGVEHVRKDIVWLFDDPRYRVTPGDRDQPPPRSASSAYHSSCRTRSAATS